MREAGNTTLFCEGEFTCERRGMPEWRTDKMVLFGGKKYLEEKWRDCFAVSLGKWWFLFRRKMSRCFVSKNVALFWGEGG